MAPSWQPRDWHRSLPGWPAPGPHAWPHASRASPAGLRPTRCPQPLPVRPGLPGAAGAERRCARRARAGGRPQLFASGRTRPVATSPNNCCHRVAGATSTRCPVRACRSSSSTARDLVYVPAGSPGGLRLGEGNGVPAARALGPGALPRSLVMHSSAWCKCFPGYSSTRPHRL